MAKPDRGPVDVPRPARQHPDAGSNDPKGTAVIGWQTFLRVVLVAVLGSGLGSAAWAQDARARLLEMRTAEVVAVLQGRQEATDVFDARFLAAVPPEQLRTLTTQLSSQGGVIEGYGDFRRESESVATFTLRFAHAAAPARIELGASPPGKVAGFRIFGLAPAGDSLDKIEADFAALPGHAGFAIYRLGDGAPSLVNGRAADRSFAIGSTFKLYVLAALARQIREGQRRWSDVVPVSGKSFPGGTIHTLPDGAPVTLHTLASLMIAISDNTAADMLVRLVGQEALAREVVLSGHARPDAIAPMMTTAQLFALKRGGRDAARRFAGANTPERVKQLAALDLAGASEAPPGEVFGHGPVAIEQVEWFASPADLAGLMDDLRRLGSKDALDILAINPALDEVTARSWTYVGYKGGSEDGVMSMTWLLRDRTGTWSVATGSWNNPKAVIDASRFELLMLRVVKAAAQ